MSERQPHIDMLRSVAILFMVEVHTAATFRPQGISASDPLGILAASIGGLAAPLFICISGWGTKRAMSRRIDAQSGELLRWVAVRFVFLLIAQLLVNLIALNIFNWYTPGVLSLLALCALLALPLSRLKTNHLATLFVLLLLSPMVLASMWDIDGSWSAVINADGMIEWLSLLLVDGTYPLFPWLGFFVLGGIIHDMQSKAASILLIISGCFSLFALLFALNTGRAWALTSNGDAVLTFFPASSAFMITASFAVLAAVLLLARVKPQSFTTPLKQSFQRIGQISLTIYLLHFIPLRIIDEMGLEPSNTFLALAVVLGYTLLWWPLASIHHRYAEKMSIETLLRRLSASTRRPN